MIENVFTCYSENELPSVIAEPFGTDRVAVDASNTRFLDVVNGQHFVTRCVMYLLGQLDNTAVNHARHSTLNLDVAADWHRPRVDAETRDDTVARSDCYSIPTCPGMTAVAATLNSDVVLESGSVLESD